MDPTIVEKPVEPKEKSRRPKYVEKGENAETKV